MASKTFELRKPSLVIDDEPTASDIYVSARRKDITAEQNKSVAAETRVDPVQDPCKTRVKPAAETRVDPVQDPCKTRVNQEVDSAETRVQTRVSESENPCKTRVKPVQKTKSAQTLSGKQKNAFFFLVLDAKENGGSLENGDRITSQICSVVLTEAASASGYEATRAITNALKKSGLIDRYQTKDGPGGWTVYRFSKSTYLEGLNCLTRIKPVQDPYKTRIKPVYQPVYKPVQTDSSSSRDLYLKETTTTQPAFDFESIDLSSVKKLGITASVLARCVELHPKLRPEQLEVLAFRFGEFAKDPKNRVQNARGFFISLAEQAAKGQVPLDHIESPDERLMRLFVERQKEAIMHKVNFEREARDFEAECWLETLAQETKLELVPETSILKAGTAPHAAMLKNYFAENVWPSRRQAILGAQP